MTIMVAAMAVAPLTPRASAIEFVGVAQMAAMDQPRINLMLSIEETGEVLMTTRPDYNDILGILAGSPNGIATVSIQAYLDTGASGILIGESLANQLGIPRAQQGGTPVTFHDVGVGGTDSFGVSVPLNFGLASYHPSADIDTQNDYVPQPNSVRVQIGPVSQLSNPAGDPLEQLISQLSNPEFNIVGMPAMAGKVVVIDSRHTNNASAILSGGTDVITDYLASGNIEGLTNLFNSLELRTYVYTPGQSLGNFDTNTNPGIPNTSHHVKMSYATFDEYTRVEPDGALGPTLAHNPFVGRNPILNSPSDNTPGVKIGFDGRSTEGSFLFDTGAAASMISTELAANLNIRYVAGTQGTENASLEYFNPTSGESLGQLPADITFSLTVGGVGGTATLAGFFLDELMLRTMEGNPLDDADPNHLKFVGAPVLVHDILLEHPTDSGKTLVLDGILGMNFLTASVNVVGNGTSFAADGFMPGAFDWIVFDEPNGILGLHVSGVPEPHAVMLAGIAALMAAAGVRRKMRRS